MRPSALDQAKHHFRPREAAGSGHVAAHPAPAPRIPETPPPPVPVSAPAIFPKRPHCCSHCGCEFSSLPGLFALGAWPGVNRVVHVGESWFRQLLGEAPFEHPCPCCGLYDRDAVVKFRSLLHLILGGFTGLLLVGIAVIGLGFHHPSGPALWALAAVSGLACLGHACAAWYDPNRSPAANRQLVAQHLIAFVEVQREGVVAPSGGGRQRAERRWLLLTALPLAATVIPLAEYVRGGIGWPTNPGLKPAIVAPGDTVRVYLPHDVRSVRGLWRGDVVATFAGQSLPARTSQEQWGRSIRVRSSERAVQPALWAEVTLPPNADLGGKTMELRVRLRVTYPAVSKQATTIRGRAAFLDQVQVVERTTPVRMAPTGTSTLYASLARLGGFGGVLLILLLGVGLIRRVAPAGLPPSEPPVAPAIGQRPAEGAAVAFSGRVGP